LNDGDDDDDDINSNSNDNNDNNDDTRRGCARARVVELGLSQQMPWFEERPVLVCFMVDRVALGQVFLQVLQFLPC
jgi:hypothetical protein